MRCESTASSSTPKAWRQTLLVPARCVRVAVTIHQDATTDRYSLHIEVDDPHTRELLSMTYDPTRRFSMVRSVAAAVALDVRHALEAVLDPDPF